MINFRAPAVLCLLFASFTQAAFAKDECLRDLSGPKKPNLELAEAVSRQSAAEVQRLLTETDPVPEPVLAIRSRRSSVKGYSILVGTMVGSAVLTTAISSHVPPGFQFVSIFITQVSTLGVYVLGAPIWEPMTSKFRKWAFGLNVDVGQKSPNSIQLEETWTRTQERYSLNAQMSRNVVSQFIFTVKENFYHAYRAHVSGDPVYAADQVAEAAYRMRILFADVSPGDPSVAAAVKSAFTGHVQIGPDFLPLVTSRLEALDADFNVAEVQEYYRAILKMWLSP